MNVPQPPVLMELALTGQVQIPGHVCAMLDGQLRTATQTSMSVHRVLARTATARMVLMNGVVHAFLVGQASTVTLTLMSVHPILACMEIVAKVMAQTNTPALVTQDGTAQTAMWKSMNANRLHARMAQIARTS